MHSHCSALLCGWIDMYYCLSAIFCCLRLSTQPCAPNVDTSFNLLPAKVLKWHTSAV
jgi:hypothetical protein